MVSDNAQDQNNDRDFPIAGALLAWYALHARILPWRAPPGAPPPDPYRVWLSEVMLQQTQVASVRPYFERFVTCWPDFASLAAAEDSAVMSAWAGLGYYARARNLLACARTVAARGALPDTEQELLTLPGIGAYTAAAIAAIAFGRRAVTVDANVERVVARLFAVEAALPGARPQIRALTDRITPDRRAGDFAQAMMDLGSMICTTRSPQCLLCPLAEDCRAKADPESYPRKAAKTERPQRYGTIFWAECDGQVLLVRRPAKGMLGGMRALPTGPWQDQPPGLADAPLAVSWRLTEIIVRHGFTHFTLDSALAVARIERQHGASQGEWWPITDLAAAGLPTLFDKAVQALLKMNFSRSFL